MSNSSGDNMGTDALRAQGLKRVWSAPTITDEDASLTAAKLPLAEENNNPTTPAGPS